MERRNNHYFDPFSGAADGDLDIDNGGFDFNDPTALVKNLSTVTPTIAKPAEVRREASARRSNLFDSFHTLRQILERHEATIQKRWLKKTRQQRIKILLEAWPNMAAPYRPDFEAFRRESKNRQLGSGATKHRDQFIWPGINQEDLAKPRTLLLLLNSRGRHDPCDFAAADGESMHLGLVTTAIVPIFLNEHIMIMNGASAAADYGKLMAWEEHPDAFDWMCARIQLLPGEGLLILEAQERLLPFLVDCCQQILHEIPPKALAGDAYPVLPEPQLKTEAEAAGFDSLVTMAAEAPYRVPAKLDFGRIVSLLAARASAAEDHVWALREDPSYFTEQLLETKEHRLESLKDTDGSDHPTMAPLRQHILWARVIGTVLSGAYLLNEVFAELLLQARHLQSLQEKHAAHIFPTKPLPDEYLAAILRFRHYLNQAAKGPLTVLKTTAIASPPLRKFFARIPPLDANSSRIEATSKPGVKHDHIMQQLLWLLQTLWEDEKPLFLARLTLIMDELERLLESETQAKELVSAYVAGVIGDLSIISQCLVQLDLYQPWANGYESKMGECQKDIENEFARHTASWGKFLTALTDANLTEAVKLGAPTEGRFAYPVGKRRTKENTEKLQQAERNLDAFWASIDRLLYVKAGNLQGTATRRLLTQPKILQRTPQWVDPPPKADGKQLAQTPQSKNAGNTDALVQPLSPFYFGLDNEKPTQSRGSAAAPSKHKTKTRGAADQDGPKAAAAAAAAAEEALRPERDKQADPQPTFSVDARALKVFRTIFFNSDVTSTPGEVPWRDFLHAMASTGFQAEKLYGSVWQFRPTTLDVERSIQFHEPHPQGKIPFQAARRLGRRLNRAYGWFGGMFVLKEK